MEEYMNIDNIKLDEDNRCFIIAELSANHGNNINIAKRTIKAAKESGADAIKIQTYTPDTMTIDCDNEYFKINQGTIWDGRYLYDLYKEAYTPWEWHMELKEYANNIGLVFFSTPFDKSAVDFLETMNVPAYKVASFEITDIPLIEYIASKQRPVIISTGIATIDDIQEAIDACRRMNNNNIVLLKCTSSYPAKLEDSNLKTIEDLKEKFNVIVGLSDHSIDIEVSLAAIALGAKVIEKHFILDRDIGGPDSLFSLEPNQFREMVEGVRKIERAIGKVDYELDEKKIKNRELSRSLFIVEDMEPGDTFTSDNIRSIRPGFGLHPKYYNQVIGKTVNDRVKRGTPLSFDLINQ
ncbi:pseudaminic acid synthase [Romboutsia sedimentorum]|uniref:Pseudaminic acid synthase n=2 Tax=Romboutsia sedimentorum TaxID=1368474 RepID=A0ABT7ECH9_9FIRM|nr:pseudaminic acid synthase [Romboutsia sedimentorum]MDK2564645.1 pseudaminic acid synthase [Romboutsia sedimentorum]